MHVLCFILFIIFSVKKKNTLYYLLVSFFMFYYTISKKSMFHLLVLDCSIWVVNLNFFGCLAILDFLVSVKLVLNNFIDCFGITKGDGS